MGTIHYVGCKDCKIVRDLDKFYTMSNSDVNNRKEALAYAKEIEEDGFRAGLLVSFLWKHKGHNVTVFTEYDEDLTYGMLNTYDGDAKEDIDFFLDDKESN